MSLSGVLLERLAEMAPATLESFQRLVATGGVELLGETYHHSLAALADRDEFVTQINQRRHPPGAVWTESPGVPQLGVDLQRSDRGPGS